MSVEIYLPKKHEKTEINKSTEKQDKYIGLYNQGNTCYLNSLLQTLFMTPQFRSIILNFDYNSKIHVDKKDCIPYQLSKLFARLQLKFRNSEDTKNLTKSFQWFHNEENEQNDIQELIHILFDALNNSEINFLFQGEMENVIKCTECNNKSIHKESFIDLSIPVKFNKKIIDSLNKSFEQFFSIELLKDDNMYQCDKCNKKVIGEKYCSINKLPKILILALNRFEYDYIHQMKKKINTKFDFPDKITEINNMKINYNLYSIIVHCGSAMGGHYYSLIKSFEDNKWYKFDDNFVFEISNFEEFKSQICGNDSNLNDNTCYILFYKDFNIEEDEKKLTFDIKDNLMNEIKFEEEEYQKLLNDEKERLSHLKLKICYDDKFENVDMRKFNKIIDLKNKFIEIFKLNIESKDCRIIIMDNGKLVNIINDDGENKNKTLEELNFHTRYYYRIEIKKPNEEFKPFDLDDTFINVIKWNDNFMKNNSLDKNEFVKIGINKKMSYDEISKIIKEKFNIPENNSILILKKQDYGINNYNLLEYTKETNGKNYFVNGQLDLYLEENKNIENSNFKIFFENQIPNIKVIFNTPISKENLKKIKRITVNSYKFDKSLEINPKKTIEQLKEEISKILNIPSDTFIMKKNSHNGVEIKKLSDKIEKYTSKVLTLYIAFGIPIKEGEFKIKIQQYTFDNSSFSLYPYKIIDCGLFIINKNDTIEMVINKIINNNEKIIKEENKIMYLRKENNFKPGMFYLNPNQKISETDIKENSNIICQYLYKENLFISNAKGETDKKEDIVNFSIRYFNQSEWLFSEPIEIITNKTISIEQFITEIIMNISKIKKWDLNQLELFGLKISNNELYYYMDEILNLDFISLSVNKYSLIGNFPLMLNSDGSLFIFKDMSKDLREPNEKEKEFYFKDKNKEIKKIVKNNKKKEQKKEFTKFNPKREVYKEKAMKIIVKQNDNIDNDNVDNN